MNTTQEIIQAEMSDLVELRTAGKISKEYFAERLRKLQAAAVRAR